MRTRNKPAVIKADGEGAAEPKSFAPHLGDPLNPNAWERLESLTRNRRPPNEIEDLISLARMTIRARRLRKRVLPAEMFGEPAWDMLLTLFVGSQSGARQTVSNLSLSSGSAPTTALRWIDYLERQAYVTRRASPTDRRVTFIDFTEAGQLLVEEYFAKLAGDEQLRRIHELPKPATR